MNIQVLASGSSGNCYKISDGTTSLLLDAGIPYKTIQRALDFKVKEIDGCLISHRHGDHAKAIPELIKRGVKVYTNGDTCLEYPRAIKVEPMKIVGIKTMDIIPFTLVHDVECYGFQIFSYETGESLLYITDTREIPYCFQRVNYLMVEANHSKQIMQDRFNAGEILLSLFRRVTATHLSLEKLKDWMARAEQAQGLKSLKEVYLMHLSQDNSDAEYFKTEIEKALWPATAEVKIC